MFLVDGQRPYKDFLVNMMLKYGITFSKKEYKEIVKKLESDKIVNVKRIPERTPTGKIARSWDYNKYSIFLELIK